MAAIPSDFPKPKFVTGGCLCGSVRYRVDFPPDHDFINASQTCQCTQCRRNTGSLFFPAHVVPHTNLTWTGSSDTLRDFSATPGCRRGFCNRCGSFLYWWRESDDAIELAVGCFDEEFMIGRRGEAQGGEAVGASSDGAAKGEEEREGYGIALAGLRGKHFWCKNEIPGVTEGMFRGTKLEKDSAHGVVMGEN